jgi:acyl carrier protein
MQVYLLDRHLEPVAMGAVGEFYVGGPGVLRGYWRRPALTADRFIPHPHGTGERLYRTGDLGRWRADGNVEFLGRADHQIKLRGYRIEPAEIEAALADANWVDRAVVVALGNAEDKRLVAYIVPREGTEPDVTSLQTHLRKRLPEFMIPSFLTVLPALPLTSNGKLDHKALPSPEIDSLVRIQYVAPRTPTEFAVAEIWAELLQIKQVGIRDNFFALGGHSLSAARAITRICDTFEIEMPLRELFEAPTIEALALRIQQAKDRQESYWASIERQLRSKIEGMSEEEIRQMLKDDHPV